MTPSNSSILIITPVFNDWGALELFLGSLDKALDLHKINADVLVVDDGSDISPDATSFEKQKFQALTSVDVLQLRRNLGHQRAIAVGLAYSEEKTDNKTILVMDADGEDDPMDIPKLLQSYNQEGQKKLIFAQRTHRSESLLFRSFYNIYRVVYYFLTGTKIRMGNFSVMPRETLNRLVVVSEIWNHYSSGILKAKIPYAEIPTKRGTRLAGKSKMNFVSLVLHGLSSLSVHADTIGVRTLIAMSILAITSTASIFTIAIIRTTSDMAIPGWASNITTSFFMILMQSLTIFIIFVFIVLGDRSNLSFLPRRDYIHFVLRTLKLYRQQ